MQPGIDELLAGRLRVPIAGSVVELRWPTGTERLTFNRRIKAVKADVADVLEAAIGEDGEPVDDPGVTPDAIMPLLEAYTWLVAVLLDSPAAPGEPIEPSPENVTRADRLWGLSGPVLIALQRSPLADAIKRLLTPMRADDLNPTSPQPG